MLNSMWVNAVISTWGLCYWENEWSQLEGRRIMSSWRMSSSTSCAKGDYEIFFLQTPSELHLQLSWPRRVGALKHRCQQLILVPRDPILRNMTWNHPEGWKCSRGGREFHLVLMPCPGLGAERCIQSMSTISLFKGRTSCYFIITSRQALLVTPVIYFANWFPLKLTSLP